ncbi:hypothetical protein Pmani_011433 [Petrolisthes manimaculis]|uniref:Ionotropic glutamate receptor L-glutamate and glycine-binding domain-containing protein n=1 Tax=Petrolisthes manimaculis TaxID=1843537 RepID=A0AAE1Q2Y9_9EUCA|nr:hypothetical protein Pmani_011433 [Petrolisthes manimaculis]
MESLYTRTRNITYMAQRVVKLVEEVEEGPARLSNLVLHLDPTLPGEVQDALYRPQRLYSPRKTSLLHLIIFMGSVPVPSSLLSPVVHTFHHVLLLNIGLDNNVISLLDHPVLRIVKSLAMITPIRAELDPLATYNLLPFCSPGLQYLGDWSQHTFPTWESLFPDRFPSTCRATFRLATWINDEPFLYHRQRDNKTVGVSVTLLHLLANKLNFSYTMTTRSVDGLWGSEENGEWNGLLGMIQHTQYDFTINSLLSSLKRATAFDECEPLGFDDVTVFLKKPSPLTKWMNLAKVGGRGWNADLGPLRAILGQSSPCLTEPRLFGGLWLLICFVLTAAYTSNLVGVFTKPAFPPQLTTLSQLLSSEIRLTVLDQGNIMMEMMKNDANPSIRRFRERLDSYVDDRQVVAAMAAGTHGYVSSVTYTSLVLINKFKASETQWHLRTVWFFKKNTPWKEKFNKNIRRLKEAGILSFWLKNELGALGYTADEGVDGGNKGVGRPGSPLTTNHLQGLFTLLGLAWALSTLIFLLEIIHKKKF